MPKRPDKRAAELLDEYLTGLMAGRPMDSARIIEQCPQSEREALRSAIAGASFVLNNYEDVLSRPELGDKARARIAEANRRKQLTDTARQRLMTEDLRRSLSADKVVSFLRDILGAGEQAQGIAGPRQPTPALMYRGRSREGPPSQALDSVRIAALEKSAADRAAEVWIRLGAPAPPINPTQLAERLGLVVVERPTEGCDGCVLMESEIGGILVNSAIRHEGRKRFTCAHEIGHFELHRDFWQSVCESLRQIESSSSDDDDPAVRYREVEANAFASELLMPSSHVKPEFSHKEPSFWAIDELAERYLVSKTAAARRVVELSDFACALLYTAEGRIRWLARSTEFPYFLAVGVPPPRYSEAAALAEGIAVDDKFVASQAAWWAPDDRTAEDAEVLEHSRLIYDDHILTLLYAKGFGE
jgi:Zn-dependent peptidase ImmA (M78 family)